MALLSEISAYDQPFDQGGGDDDQYPNGPNPGPNLPAPTPTAPAGGGGLGALPPQLINFLQQNQGGGGHGGGGGGGGYGLGSAFPDFNFGAAPKFTAPQFALPSFSDAQNEPGYQFRLKAGSDALERSAAAKGLLRTGG